MATSCYSENNPYSHHALSALEKCTTERTLICLLRACQGYRTMVELRNESTCFGEIANVDGFMNVIMTDATFTTIKGNTEYFAELHIIGKNIRYVHIPDEIDILSSIEEEVEKIHKSRSIGDRRRLLGGHGRGSGRGRGSSRGRGRGYSRTNEAEKANGQGTSFKNET